jgi:hypothetical protein
VFIITSLLFKRTQTVQEISRMTLLISNFAAQNNSETALLTSIKLKGATSGCDEHPAKMREVIFHAACTKSSMK